MSNDEQTIFDLYYFRKTLVWHWSKGNDTKEEDIVNLVYYLYNNIKKVNVVNFAGFLPQLPLIVLLGEYNCGTYYIKVVDTRDREYEITMNHGKELLKYRFFNFIYRVVSSLFKTTGPK